MNDTAANASIVRPGGKMIMCVLPDDGTSTRLLEQLKASGKEYRAYNHSCLGTDTFADAKVRPGTLPDAYLVRVVKIATTAEKADDLFAFICETARINRPGGGLIMQSALLATTPYELPEEPADD